MPKYTHKLAEQQADILVARALCESSGKELPPDPDAQNDDRSAWAQEAVLAFMQRTGVDFEDAVADLLADLRHFCDRHGQDWDRLLTRANDNYEDETA